MALKRVSNLIFLFIANSSAFAVFRRIDIGFRYDGPFISPVKLSMLRSIITSKICVAKLSSVLLLYDIQFVLIQLKTLS